MDDVMDKPTTTPISTRKHGDVLIILSNNPPVNALGSAVRKGLVDAIEQAEGDDSVTAVVIVCEGQTFFAGADVSEFGTPKAFEQPMLPQVVDRIEGCTKPVVAAIHGTALGGGLEVALACHYRVAVPSAKLGTPEVKLGLLPGAGGTQRLPRVAGVKKALQMCATGNPIGAKEAFDCGLVDRIVEGDLIPHAVAFAEEVRDVRPLAKSSERQDRIDIQCASADTVGKRFAVEQFHNDEMLSLKLLYAVDRADVRMIKRRCGASLSLKPLQKPFVLRQRRRQKF